MMTMRSNEPEPSRTILNGTDGPGGAHETARPLRDRPREEWDRGEWVGEGQEPEGAQAHPAPAETEPRWTKWEWVGEGQGGERPLHGSADDMPEGANALSGNRHNPGMAHWGGSRSGRRGS